MLLHNKVLQLYHRYDDICNKLGQREKWCEGWHGQGVRFTWCESTTGKKQISSAGLHIWTNIINIKIPILWIECNFINWINIAPASRHQQSPFLQPTRSESNETVNRRFNSFNAQAIFSTISNSNTEHWSSSTTNSFGSCLYYDAFTQSGPFASWSGHLDKINTPRFKNPDTIWVLRPVSTSHYQLCARHLLKNYVRC